MRKHQILGMIALTTSLIMGGVLVKANSNFSFGHIFKGTADGCNHVGNHYIRREPTPILAGYKEFYVCCKCNEKFINSSDDFEAPSGTWSTIQPLASGFPYGIDKNDNFKRFIDTLEYSCNFTHKDVFLYKIGNENSFNPNLVFENANCLKINDTKIGNVTFSDGKSMTSFENGNVCQFKNTGIVELIPGYDNVYDSSKSVIVEVINATNATGRTSATNGDVVLLKDNTAGLAIGYNGLTVENGYTFYGNGFTIEITNDSWSPDLASGFVALNNGSIDNLSIKVPHLSEQYLYTGDRKDSDFVNNGNNLKDYNNTRSAVVTNGTCNITNCFIDGGRHNIHLVDGNLNISNSYLSNGAITNIYADSSASRLCVTDLITKQEPTKATVNETSNTLMGFGIFMVVDGTQSCCSLELNGYLKQYNWYNSNYSSYLPSGVSTIGSTLLNKSSLVHTVNEKSSVNLTICFCVKEKENPDVNEETASNSITDNRNNKDSIPYSIMKLTVFSKVGYGYCYDNSNGLDDELISAIDYQPSSTAKSPVEIRYKDVNENIELTKFYSDAYGHFETVLTVSSVAEININDLYFEKYGNSYPYTSIYSISYDESNKEVETEFSDSSIVCNDIRTHRLKLVGTINTLPTKSRLNLGGSYSVSLYLRIESKVLQIDKPTVTTNYQSGICVASSYGGQFSGAAPVLEGVSIKYYSSTEKKYVDLSLNSLTPTTNGKQNGTNNTWAYTNNDFSLTLTGGQVHQKNNVNAMPVVCDSKMWFVASSTSGLVNTGNSARTIPVSYSFTANGDTLSFSYTWSVEENKDDEYSYSDFCNGTLKKLENNSGGSSGGCISGDTLISLINGTKVRADSLKAGDVVASFNHETGKVEPQIILHNEDAEMQAVNETIIHLMFSNNSEIKVISEHGFFDYNLMKYVYITETNYGEYIGHQFASIEGNNISKVELVNAFISNEEVSWCSPTTAYNLNIITNDILSMPGGIKGMFNYFDFDDDLKYNKTKMAFDIETYGLYTYEEFSSEFAINEYSFDVYNGKYLKVSLGKGLITKERINYLLDRYGQYTANL